MSKYLGFSMENRPKYPEYKINPKKTCSGIYSIINSMLINDSSCKYVYSIRLENSVDPDQMVVLETS